MPEVFVSKIDDFAEGDRRIVFHGGLEIGVFHWQGNYYAYENLCLHQGGPCCEGVIMHKVEDVLAPDKTWRGQRFSDDEAHFVCPWHGYEYDITHRRMRRQPQAPAQIVRGRCAAATSSTSSPAS